MPNKKKRDPRKMPKCPCGGRLVHMYTRQCTQKDTIGYICRDCKSFIFTIKVGSRLAKVFFGLEEVYGY